MPKSDRLYSQLVGVRFSRKERAGNDEIEVQLGQSREIGNFTRCRSKLIGLMRMRYFTITSTMVVYLAGGCSSNAHLDASRNDQRPIRQT